MTLRDMCLRSKKLLHDKKDEFRATFGVSLEKFMDPITGFDLLKFDDEVLKSPGGTSISEAIEVRYGKDAVNLVAALI